MIWKNAISRRKFVALTILVLVCGACSPPRKKGAPAGASKSGKPSPSAAGGGAASVDGRKIRVLLGTFQNFSLEGNGSIRVTDIAGGRTLKTANGRLAGGDLENGRYRVAFTGEIFSLGKVRYRGQVLLFRSGANTVIINELPLEHYLYGVVPSEMSSGWPMEALKAQAVCARTYALTRMLAAKSPHYHLDNSTASQVYSGMSRESADTSAAVDATAGEVLAQEGKPINAFFFSTCGGRTELAENVWGSADGSTQIIDCPHCREARNYAWRAYAGRDRLNKLTRSLGLGAFVRMEVIQKTASGRAGKIRVEGTTGQKVVNGGEFRLKLGADVLRSLLFTQEKSADGILFRGRGWGHGVGMCQNGAKKMAANNDYRSILRFYFRAVNLRPADRLLASIDRDSVLR